MTHTEPQQLINAKIVSLNKVNRLTSFYDYLKQEASDLEDKKTKGQVVSDVYDLEATQLKLHKAILKNKLLSSVKYLKSSKAKSYKKNYLTFNPNDSQTDIEIQSFDYSTGHFKLYPIYSENDNIRSGMLPQIGNGNANLIKQTHKGLKDKSSLQKNSLFGNIFKPNPSKGQKLNNKSLAFSLGGAAVAAGVYALSNKASLAGIGQAIKYAVTSDKKSGAVKPAVETDLVTSEDAVRKTTSVSDDAVIHTSDEVERTDIAEAKQNFGHNQDVTSQTTQQPVNQTNPTPVSENIAEDVASGENIAAVNASANEDDGIVIPETEGEGPQIGNGSNGNDGSNGNNNSSNSNPQSSDSSSPISQPFLGGGNSGGGNSGGGSGGGSGGSNGLVEGIAGGIIGGGLFGKKDGKDGKDGKDASSGNNGNDGNNGNNGNNGQNGQDGEDANPLFDILGSIASAAGPALAGLASSFFGGEDEESDKNASTSTAQTKNSSDGALKPCTPCQATANAKVEIYINSGGAVDTKSSTTVKTNTDKNKTILLPTSEEESNNTENDNSGTLPTFTEEKNNSDKSKDGNNGILPTIEEEKNGKTNVTNNGDKSSDDSILLPTSDEETDTVKDPNVIFNEIETLEGENAQSDVEVRKNTKFLEDTRNEQEKIKIQKSNLEDEIRDNERNPNITEKQIKRKKLAEEHTKLLDREKELKEEEKKFLGEVEDNKKKIENNKKKMTDLAKKINLPIDFTQPLTSEDKINPNEISGLVALPNNLGKRSKRDKSVIAANAELNAANESIEQIKNDNTLSPEEKRQDILDLENFKKTIPVLDKNVKVEEECQGCHEEEKLKKEQEEKLAKEKLAKEQLEKEQLEKKKEEEFQKEIEDRKKQNLQKIEERKKNSKRQKEKENQKQFQKELEEFRSKNNKQNKKLDKNKLKKDEINKISEKIVRDEKNLEDAKNDYSKSKALLEKSKSDLENLYKQHSDTVQELDLAENDVRNADKSDIDELSKRKATVVELKTKLRISEQKLKSKQNEKQIFSTVLDNKEKRVNVIEKSLKENRQALEKANEELNGLENESNS